MIEYVGGIVVFAVIYGLGFFSGQLWERGNQ